MTNLGFGCSHDPTKESLHHYLNSTMKWDTCRSEINQLSSPQEVYEMDKIINEEYFFSGNYKVVLLV